MSFKGFVFNSADVKTLLNKLNNFVLVSNTDNLTDTKIYTSTSFNASNPNFFVEASAPDLSIREDPIGTSRLISSIGTGSGVITIGPKVLTHFAGNGYIGSNFYSANPDNNEYGILFLHTDIVYIEPTSNMQVWRNNTRFHILLNRVELYPDGSNAEVSIDVYYNFSNKNVYIRVSNLQNFGSEPNLPFRFGICGETTNITTDLNILKINIDPVNFTAISGLNLYKAVGLTATELKVAGFTDFEILGGGYNIFDIIGSIYTKTETNVLLDSKANLATTYTKTQTDALLNDLKTDINKPITTLQTVSTAYVQKTNPPFVGRRF